MSADSSAEAVDGYSRVITILEPIVEREDPVPDSRECLRIAYGGRAQSLAKLQRHEEAIADWEKLIVLDEKTFQGVTPNERRRDELAGVYRGLAQSYRVCGQEQKADEAARTARDLEAQ
jgi:hypothetical protein